MTCKIECTHKAKNQGLNMTTKLLKTQSLNIQFGKELEFGI